MANGKIVPSVSDVVTLASGGPPMTVAALENAPAGATPLAPGAVPPVHVRCIWFNPAGAYASAVFPAEVLIQASGDNAARAPTSPPTVS